MKFRIVIIYSKVNSNLWNFVIFLIMHLFRDNILEVSLALIISLDV